MIKWRKLYKESVEEVNLKKLLKQNGVTKLPSGTQFKPDRISWSKDGGYAGQKTLDKVCSQLEDAGWKRGEWRTGGIPDGSAVTNSNAYTSPDGRLVMTYSEHFGATAHDNFYGFTFKLVGAGVNESSRFGFKVGDRVVLTKDKSNRFSGDFICAGTEGEIVAVDKPMPGVMKVKIEDWKIISVPERNLKLAGTDNEPWEKLKKPPEPPRKPSEEELLHSRPEWIYMEPPKPGSPKWTGD